MLKREVLTEPSLQPKIFLFLKKVKHMCIHNHIYRDKAQKPKSQGHSYIKSEVLISTHGEANNTFVLFYRRKID